MRIELVVLYLFLSLFVVGFQCRSTYDTQFRQDFAYLLPDNEEFVANLERIFTRNNVTYNSDAIMIKYIISTEIRTASPEISNAQIIERIEERLDRLGYLNEAPQTFQSTEMDTSASGYYEDHNDDGTFNNQIINFKENVNNNRTFIDPNNTTALPQAHDIFETNGMDYILAIVLLTLVALSVLVFRFVTNTRNKKQGLEDTDAKEELKADIEMDQL